MSQEIKQYIGKDVYTTRNRGTSLYKNGKGYRSFPSIQQTWNYLIQLKREHEACLNYC